MQNKYFIIRLTMLMMAWSEVFSQREDYHWMFGYSDRPGVDTNFGRAELLFTDSSYKIKKTYNLIHKLNYTNASICDTSGKLLFYTNGLEVYNREHQIMPNGDDLNPGEFANSSEKVGYTQDGGALILPWPNHNNKYLLIHTTTDRVPFIWYSLNVLITKVDMSLNNTKGDVVYKNKSIFADSLIRGSLTACRHANGRDWWIPIFYYRGGKCFMFLFDPSGIKLHHIQDIPFEFCPSGGGQAHYSPDGNRYAFLHKCSQEYRELFYANFDRCAGQFSDMHYYIYPKFELIGIAFSPNNRYLYFGTGRELYQIDFEDSFPYQQKIMIDYFDGFESFPGFPSYFHLMQLAPDNKIYICNGRSPYYLSTIEKPDLKGKDCSVKQHNIRILANSTLPNFPYFRLGALKGSACDTIGLVKTSEIPKSKKWNVYYNQLDDLIVIEDSELQITKVQIYGMNGSLLYQNEFQEAQIKKTIEVHQFIAGIYLIKVKFKNGSTSFSKTIIINN